MPDSIRRLFVQKKPGFDVEAQNLCQDLRENLAISGLESVRILNRYDIAGISAGEYLSARETVFAEPTVDFIFEDHFQLAGDEQAFAMEYLPGQFDQRADSAAQCVQLITGKDKPLLLSARVIVLKGAVSEGEMAQVREYCINPVDSRQAVMARPESLELAVHVPEDVATLEGFSSCDEEELAGRHGEMGLAMSLADFRFCQDYFRDQEKRDPTVTEIRVIDTYWSDHCRHTTFLTRIEGIEFAKGHFNTAVETAFRAYQKSRDAVYGDLPRDISLMDIATLTMKEMRKKGLLPDLDESEEINACSIVVPVDVDGQREDWLVQFKNETHNHPTEIEPFGGAATCLGGAIRDPLSGRAYVYQAMRVTGSGDPRQRISDTLPGKLPQRKITTEAAHGYSAYGNQIGLATGQVAEVYHPGFVAKRMEIGAVIGAVPKKNVLRAEPQASDVVILLGGRTGRDGIGGATGSSKEHTEESILTCGAEVQKGNPPTERKIQRLFRNPLVSGMIKKCNDFGAGGVAVAIGELTAGLDIQLDVVPKKYEGLDGTELAISESQERMAVVVAAADAAGFIHQAALENLEATVVAEVKNHRRLRMFWRGRPIVDLSRDFLDTNGVRQRADVLVESAAEEGNFFRALPEPVAAALPDLKSAWLAALTDLNVCSQRGLGERFDSTVGGNSVLLPYGGRFQCTPAEGMAAKIPLLRGETTTATLMAYGYDPRLASWSPFLGAVYAVVSAVCKIVAMGGSLGQTRLTLQEYFEKLGQEPSRWGKPFSALLGAFYAQKKLGIPAIGGKDSMSGTFKDLQVPPTLVAFAVAAADAGRVLSPEFKQVGSRVVWLPLLCDEYEMPDFVSLKETLARVEALIASGAVLAAATVKYGGLAEAVSKMCFGNRIGLAFYGDMDEETLFAPDYGSLVLEVAAETDLAAAFGDTVVYDLIGHTIEAPVILVNERDIDLDEACARWEAPLEHIFPTRVRQKEEAMMPVSWSKPGFAKPALKVLRPRVLLPVFPGTNCEYETARAFEKAGGQADILVVRNRTAADIRETVAEIVRRLAESQILMLSGGFSAGDEPDGSGKFIAAIFRNPLLREAVSRHLEQRDGLILGICNGFQALIKLGLVPYGRIVDLTADSPTLTFNTIGRHQSSMVETKVVSRLSPWFANVEEGARHTVAVSHGEGRFAASEEVLRQLIQGGQIATRYVDREGQPSMDIRFNPNGSLQAVEGITSPDGRVLGKMGHSERVGRHVAVNMPGEKDQPIFQAGIRYFK